MIPDPIEAIRLALLSSATVREKVGTRVYGRSLPPREAENMPVPCTVLTRSGGFRDADQVPMSTVRVDVRSYGGSGYEAAAVDLVVYEYLNALDTYTHNRCVLYSAVMTGGPTDLIDEPTEWPYVLRVFDVLVGDYKEG